MFNKMTKFNWVLEPEKFLSQKEVKKLLRIARKRARIAATQGCKVPVRDYFIVDLALSTGLRVMEIAQLNCGDIYIQDSDFLLLVRKGKGGKKRLVRFGRSFKRHYEQYILWKQKVGEPTGLSGSATFVEQHERTHDHTSNREGLQTYCSQSRITYSLLNPLSQAYLCMPTLQGK